MNPFSDAARWFSATQVLDRRRRDPQMSRKKRRARSRAFAAMLEPLEDRTVLNVSSSVSGATITFTSDSAFDNLALQTTSGEALTYTDSSYTTPQSTGFTVGKNQSIIVTEPDSGGTLNLQNVNTQGGSLTIDNDVTVTGSLNTGGGAVNISGGTITVNSTPRLRFLRHTDGPQGPDVHDSKQHRHRRQCQDARGTDVGYDRHADRWRAGHLCREGPGLTTGSTYAVDVPDSSSPTPSSSISRPRSPPRRRQAAPGDLARCSHDHDRPLHPASGEGICQRQ